MNKIVRALEEEIYQLCERPHDKQTALEKQRLYSRIGQFLMGSFDGHWWCRYPTLMTFMVRILELHPGPDSVRMFYDRMAQQLGMCTKCVDIYHSAMPTVRLELENEFTLPSVHDFFHKIAQLDSERIHNALSVKTGATPGAGPQNSVISNALYEVLSNRRLWSDFRVVRVVSKWLSATPEAVKSAVVDTAWLTRATPGVLQWLVTPDPGIRAWATSLLGKLGLVDLTADTGDDRPMMKVLDEWMYILESNSFNTSLLKLDLPSIEELPMFLELQNCVKTPTTQVLWAALDIIMQHLNEDSLEALLESFDNLPDLVFNYLNDADPASTNPQITYVICKCYGSLLKCLGHRYWNHTVHSPKVVLDLVFYHSSLPSWRVFVTKQLIELLPPLIAAMRPPTTSQSEAAKPKLQAYFDARRRVLLFLLHNAQRPSHFTDQVLCVTASKAVSTLVCDCYEPRLTSTAQDNSSSTTKRDDGALPELRGVDLSVADNAFWWPCGPSSQDVEHLWMNHLFLLLVNPENVASLVDHVAVTCTTVLQKHLSLARERVYRACVATSSDAASSAALEQTPIATRLFERICAWPSIATIPIAVHGAMFESIGGVAELLNLLATRPPATATAIKDTLTKYEASVCGGYLARLSDEVLVKGLTNPFRFPVVAQHLSLWLLSPTATVDDQCKKLLAHAGAKPGEQLSSLLEALLVTVHRNAEAFMRGLLTLLQCWRRYEFALPVVLPTVAKTIVPWTNAFAMLGAGLTTALRGEAAATDLHKLPTLIGDCCVRVLTQLYPSATTVVDETVAVQWLDFSLAFWKFFASYDRVAAGSKRFEDIVAPLVECVDGSGRGVSEKRRAVELLLAMSSLFADAQTRLSERAITRVETIKLTSVSALQQPGKPAPDFRRAANRLRQVVKTASFFSPRLPKSSSSSSSSSRRSSGDKGSSSMVEQQREKQRHQPSFVNVSSDANQRAMSGKAAAREQAQLANARSAASTIYEAAPKKDHSFYDESDLVPTTTAKKTTPSSGGRDERGSKGFSIAQVVKGMEVARPGLRQVRDDRTHGGKEVVNVEDDEEEEEEEEDEDTANLAAVFFKIKHMQKAIPSSSLLPFYRHLLQLAMPSLLTKEFAQERSERELTAPPLSFAKSAEYTGAFLPLLLEESLNEVHEGLRKSYFSNGRGHLMRYESEKPREGMRCLAFSVVESDASLVLGGPRGGARGGAPNRFVRREKLFRNADVVLLKAVGTRQHSGGGEFMGVILISESERGKRRQGGRKTPNQTSNQNSNQNSKENSNENSNQNSTPDDEELVRVLFLNDGELESVTTEIASFKMETLAASAVGDSEWRVTPVGNLVTSSREYIALRSVDMLPEHLRATILTPQRFESLQTELLQITTSLDELRAMGKDDASVAAIKKLLRQLNRCDVTLTELRSTSIGKAVNKLRKHEHSDVQRMAQALKDKWTLLMAQKDALDVAPKFVSAALWKEIKPQYNQSQLQAIHSVLNNYRAGVSLLQGPPGTGKTKTIMGLLSGFLSLQMPASLVRLPAPAKEKGGAGSAVLPSSSSSASSFTNFDLARDLAAKQSPAFTLAGTSSSARLLRHSDDSNTVKPSAIQALKASGGARSRLEAKLSNRPSSADVVRRTLLGPSVLSSTIRPSGARVQKAHVLLCAPSNGAVDELVLRIVTDGLLDSSGQRVKVRAPSVHPEVLGEASGFLSIVRLGNAGEDAPVAVQAVCLPHIIKHELEIHPKTIEFRALQDRQNELRTAIKTVHNQRADEKKNAAATDDTAETSKPSKRSGLPKLHAELTEVSGKLRRLRNEVTALEGKMTSALLSSASIIACTLSKAGGGQFNSLPRGFDALIVDEAAQAVELSTLVPIRERVARVVLVGDPKQLPATVKSVAAAAARMDRSLFERIAASGVAPAMLRVQYRMHPFLREFPSKKFYGGLLTDGASVLARVAASGVRETVYRHACFQPFLLYDVGDTQESSDASGTGSKVNVKEAAFCVELCAALFETCGSAVRTWSVGFVSPYKEQVHTLRREVARRLSSGGVLPATASVEVNTVDGFQGREKDVVIFSCVRASPRGGIGFLKDVRRLNVAITRARFCLFVVGDVRTLQRDDTWRALVESAAERRLVVRASAGGGGFATVQRAMEGSGEGERRRHFALMHDKLEGRKAEETSVKEEEEEEGKNVKVEETSDVTMVVEKEVKAEVKREEKAASPSHGSDRSSRSESASRERQPAVRGRSRSRERPRGGSARATDAVDLKRPPPRQPHESEPSKSQRTGRDSSHRRRSRSRSRGRSRERRPTAGPSPRSASTASTASSTSSSRDTPTVPARDQPILSSSSANAGSSDDKKHHERQQRLKALRDDAKPTSGSSRIVQLVRQGSATSVPTATGTGSSKRPPSGGGSSSLLGSILGSSKQLASATARLQQDKHR